MTKLPITEDDLHGYIDHALSAERRAEVAAYLGEHEDVAARLAAYAAQGAALRDLFAPIADEPVPADLRPANFLEARSPALRWRQVAAAIALVAAGFAGGWGGQMLVQRADSAGIGALAQEAAQNYALFAADYAHPVDVGRENPDKLASYLSQVVKRPVRIPDLSASGYRLMGGRIVATDHGPAALLMYDDAQGTRLAVFSRPMAVDRDRKMTEASIEDVTGFSWAARGMGYSLVGQLPPDTLHPIANAIRTQLGFNA